MVARVLVLTFTDVANDPRVMRHIRALAREHEVVSCGKGAMPPEVVEHVRIPDHAVALPKRPGVITNLALRRHLAAYWGSAAARAARAGLAGAAFDLVLTNDALTLPVAFEVAGARPVVADLHEFAPGQVDSARFRLMVGPLMDTLCRTYLPRAAAVTTVCDGIAEEYQRQYGVAVSTITNAGPDRSPAPRPVGAPIRLVHTGAAMPNRQLELMIKAAADVPGITFDLFLVTPSWAAGYLKSLRALAASSSNVRVLDPVPMAEVPATLDGYDIGLFVLPPRSINNRFALPNKFFDFVQSGLGIVVGPSPEMARLVSRHGLGLVLPDFTESGLRAALQTLDPARVAAWKAASCAASAQLGGEHQADLLRAVVARGLQR